MAVLRVVLPLICVVAVAGLRTDPGARAYDPVAKLIPAITGPLASIMRQIPTPANVTPPPANWTPNGANMSQMEELMKAMDELVVALKDPKLVKALYTALDDLQGSVAKAINATEGVADHFIAEANSGIAAEDIVADYGAAAKRDLQVIERLMRQLLGNFRPLMPMFPSAWKEKFGIFLNYTATYTRAAISDAKARVDELLNGTVAFACLQQDFMYNPKTGTPAIMKDVHAQVQELDKMMVMVPAALPLLCGQHPEMTSVVSDLMGKVLATFKSVGKLVEQDLYNTNTKIVPVFTDKLHCRFGTSTPWPKGEAPPPEATSTAAPVAQGAAPAAQGAAPAGRRLGLLAGGLAALAGYLSL